VLTGPAYLAHIVPSPGRDNEPAAIADVLNARRVPTPAGSRHWHPAQVARDLKRLAG
jgi:hypothetical protein